MDSEQAVRALGALAQDHRLAAFRLLVQAGHDGLAAGALAQQLDLPPSSLSFHLAQLSQAELITQQRIGRSLIYSANYAAMGNLMAFLTENCCGSASPCAQEALCSPTKSLERNEI